MTVEARDVQTVDETIETGGKRFSSSWPQPFLKGSCTGQKQGDIRIMALKCPLE